jgi:hypothetical protein
VNRVIDRGAITAAYVGIGMAITVAISFLLVIPIEPAYLLLSLPMGLLIGYYANQRSGRAGGPWRRIVANALVAGVVTAVTVALLLVAVKALFFFADNGFRDPGLGGPLSCRPGADCVYQRYLADGRGADLSAQGVTDAASFGRLYWGQQLATATFLLLGTTGAAVVGGVLFGATQRKRPNGLVPGSPGASGVATSP